MVTEDDLDRVRRIARSVARERGMVASSVEDLESAGMWGLASACRGYRSGEVSFWSFARSRVEGAMRDEIRSSMSRGIVGGNRAVRGGSPIRVESLDYEVVLDGDAVPFGHTIPQSVSGRSDAVEAVHDALGELPERHREEVMAAYKVDGRNRGRGQPSRERRRVEAEAMEMLRGVFYAR